ncbi:alpha-N-arabinofuranosidase [Xylanimonas allomyrinae]|uniref:non-reducing end alpha-L-arabinofuranosidase n=1 Tax=Xylanimonas allomyrinae TaxID=2509459 RepID=A0A4P6EQS7_9MICO|nr:alpha-N-arabinofuranosidase [Xylanimonas allomyrinae]QAY64213.1 alpha-N-arabinofuranosidase [Xylanimonas allomyrinae]
MHNASVTVNPAFVVGPVRPRTFGSFVEHLGRCVYEGIYEPGHPTADADGFRGDVAELTRELGTTTVRYPGGNFVSGYKWEDGIGPKEDRPARLDLAWHSTDPNTVGVDEFMLWCQKVGVEPMMAVNLGTRGVAEALDILEYCNIPGGTAWSEQRKANGAEDPYRVQMWCLGNEMDGPWQTGHKTAEEYARLATESARAMRQMQPGLELVVCGSSSSDMDTFGTWEYTVLSEAYEHVDYVSAHEYYYEDGGDLASFLGSAVKMDRFIKSVVAVADAVRAAGKHDKRINISFDEWNVWYQQATPSKPPTGDDWPVAPALLEDVYTVADAVVVGDLLITLLRNTDRVHAASLAQLVNVIAPIMTETGGRAWKQTIFHPFALTANNARGDVLQVAVDAPTIATERHGEIPALSAVATHDPATGDVVVFAANRSTSDAVALDIDLSAFAGLEIVEALTYGNDDPYWTATADDSTSVLPAHNTTAVLADGRVTAELPATSWTMVRLGTTA